VTEPVYDRKEQFRKGVESGLMDGETIIAVYNRDRAGTGSWG